MKIIKNSNVFIFKVNRKELFQYPWKMVSNIKYFKNIVYVQNMKNDFCFGSNNKDDLEKNSGFLKFIF